MIKKIQNHFNCVSVFLNMSEPNKKRVRQSSKNARYLETHLVAYCKSDDANEIWNSYSIARFDLDARYELEALETMEDLVISLDEFYADEYGTTDGLYPSPIRSYGREEELEEESDSEEEEEETTTKNALRFKGVLKYHWFFDPEFRLAHPEFNHKRFWALFTAEYPQFRQSSYQNEYEGTQLPTCLQAAGWLDMEYDHVEEFLDELYPKKEKNK